jgi:hypothetical protein
MNPGTLETPRYASLRKGGKVLDRLALWVQLGFLIMGMGLFLDQARDLLSDAQFTWGERRVTGVITPARKFRMLLHTNPTRERGEYLGTRAGASEDM